MPALAGTAAPAPAAPRAAVRITIETAPLTEPAALAPGGPRPAPAVLAANPALPDTARQRAEAAPDVQPRQPLARIDAPLPDMAAPAPLTVAEVQQPQTPVTAPAAPPVEPRDFTALLDRLVAAREAMRGDQTRVTMALPHAEFGQVRLDFRQDERGLSVSIASTDPAFARAASAALPLAPSAPPADAGTRQGSEGQPRAQAEAHGSGPGGGAGSRGGNAGGQSERESGRNAFTAPRTDRRSTGESSQQGIFA